jgi:hypothetical protein
VVGFSIAASAGGSPSAAMRSIVEQPATDEAVNATPRMNTRREVLELEAARREFMGFTLTG